ncbi:UNVERIFIED_CONTAM: hypothetical protein HDU68_008293 [Siphonaria sp. JEL0065]|nr:hypothetical protein HDU68_008293 [Siphonaria sp. JEL0065]
MVVESANMDREHPADTAAFPPSLARDVDTQAGTFQAVAEEDNVAEQEGESVDEWENRLAVFHMDSILHVYQDMVPMVVVDRPRAERLRVLKVAEVLSLIVNLKPRKGQVPIPTLALDWLPMCNIDKAVPNHIFSFDLGIPVIDVQIFNIYIQSSTETQISSGLPHKDVDATVSW